MSRAKTRRTPNAAKSRKTTKATAPARARTAELPALTLREFAQLVNRAPATVSAWCESGMPHEIPGKTNAGYLIRLASALPWVLNFALEPPKESQRERLAREQADKFAIENAVRRGELVDAVMVGEVFKAWAVALSAQHKTMKNRCAHEFAGITDPQRIRERFDEEFATTGEALAAVVGDLAATCERVAESAAAAENAAAAHAGPVGRRESSTAEREC